MKLDDIKLGMKVIVVKDRTEEGWVPLLPDIVPGFILQTNLEGKDRNKQ